MFTTAALAALFLIGILQWSFFINFGDVENWQEWGERNYYQSVVREAIVSQNIPYIVPGGYYPSDRFMANLQVPLSPQFVLMTVMRPDQFVLFNTLLMYTLGFLGCLLIRKRYGLSLVPFTVLFLLFNFNGSITAHISVGHPWLGYFLAPFFVLLVLELVQPQRGGKLGVSILLTLVLFAILLQGSFHVFVWCALFLGLLGLFNRPLLSSTVFILASSAFLGLFRVLPAMFFYSDVRPSYASGFPSIPVFIDSLTTIKTFLWSHPRTLAYDVRWFELDMFIGFVGVGFIAFFGIYQRFSKDPKLDHCRLPALDLPILLMILFSFGLVFDLISDLRVPLLSFAEQVPVRMFILPLLFLAVLGSIRMQEFLPQIKAIASLRFLTLAAILQLTHSLAAHSWFWRVPSSVEAWCCYRSFNTLDDGTLEAAGPVFMAPGSEDFLYIMAVMVSTPISLLSLATLGLLFYWKVWRVRPHVSSTQPAEER